MATPPGPVKHQISNRGPTSPEKHLDFVNRELIPAFREMRKVVNDIIPPAGSLRAELFGMSPANTPAGNVAALTAAITAASGSGAEVIVPPGVFPWLVPSHGVTAGMFAMSNVANVMLRGAGSHATILLDPQAPATDGVSNASGPNAFLTCTDWVDCEIRDIGFSGALSYQQNSLSNIAVITSRKAIYLRAGTTGCKRIDVHDCYFTHIEGEVFFLDGADSMPAEDCVVHHCEFRRNLSNQVNVASGTQRGAFRCGGHHNVMVDFGAGSLLQAGGTDVVFHHNLAYWTPNFSENAADALPLFQGANLILLASFDGADVHSNVIRGVYTAAGAPTVVVGIGGGSQPNNGLKLHDNAFIDLHVLGDTGTAAIVTIDSSIADCTNYLVENNKFDAITEYNHAVYPNVVGIRLRGANAHVGTIGTNHFRAGSAAHPLTIGIKIEAGIPAGNTIRVLPQDIDATVTTPLLYQASPTATGLRFPPVAITNKAAGGVIGTASATVDTSDVFVVNQTTAGQTLTLPNPTDTTDGKLAFVANKGSTSFTMYGKVIAAGAYSLFVWFNGGWGASI